LGWLDDAVKVLQLISLPIVIVVTLYGAFSQYLTEFWRGFMLGVLVVLLPMLIINIYLARKGKGNKQKLDSLASPITDTDLKSEQVIREGIDSEFVLSDMQWTILEAAQASFGNATSTVELAKTTGLDNTTVYRECVILRDTGYVDFTDDSLGMALLKITGHGLLALRERDRLTR